MAKMFVDVVVAIKKGLDGEMDSMPTKPIDQR